MYALVMIIYTATYAINSAPGGAMVRGSNPVISYTITNVANLIIRFFVRTPPEHFKV